MIPDVRLTIDTGASAALSVVDGASVALSVEVSQGSAPYTDRYEVTPTNQEQVLPTAGCNLAADVVIHPIPQNYGLITWNGSTLTVS